MGEHLFERLARERGITVEEMRERYPRRRSGCIIR